MGWNGIGAALLLLLGSAPSFAQMYKCQDARGVTQYADKPCPDGKGKEVDIRGQPPISGKVTPYREDLKSAERDLQRRQAQREQERRGGCEGAGSAAAALHRAARRAATHHVDTPSRPTASPTTTGSRR